MTRGGTKRTPRRSRPPNTGPLRARVLPPGERTWERMRDRALALERAEWGRRAFSEREMRRQFSAPASLVSGLWEGGRLVGFAVAGPSEWHSGASLFNVLIDPAFRGRGLVWRLLRPLERVLRLARARALVIDARIDNGFADAVERHYGPRARVVWPDHDSPYGPQRTIEVSLVPARHHARPIIAS